MSESAVVIRKGLDDVIVQESSISFVDGKRGKLLYRGFDIEELAKKSSFEEVAYILWHNGLPGPQQFDDIKRQLATSRALPGRLISLLKFLPGTTHPMDVLKTAVAVLASFDSELNDNSPAANLRKAIRLTAKFPTIVAAFERLRTGEEPISPDPQLDHAANFLYMLSGTQPTVLAARAMDASLILHMEHEMNASTFACTVTASTLSDLYSAVISGLGTLKGPLHGGANEQALKMLQEIESPATAERFVLQALSQKRKLPGFGHRVYKAYDPRARIFKDFVKDLSDARHERRFYEIAARVETVMIRELGEAKGVFPNIDFYSGIVYQLLGIPMDLFTPIFAMARVVGWTAHVMEYLEDNRLVRPRAHYIGPLDRAYIPMELRGAVRPPEREPPVSLLTPPV